MNPPSKNYGAAGDVDPKNQGAAVSKPQGRFGDRPSLNLDRLLRSAARVKDETPAEMPFGFDTRVIALSRKNGNGAAFGVLLRWVALVAAAVIVLASAGAYFEFNSNPDLIVGGGNEFAIADSVIQDEVAQ